MNDETGTLGLGDPRLRRRAEPVGASDASADVARLFAALAAVRSKTGFGRALAAPQLGIARRIVAVDLGAGPFALVDPEIARRSDETFLVWDDCFSVPDRLVRVRRHASVDLCFRDESGRAREWNALPRDLAELVQHELDHLDGVLMVDRAEGEDAVQPMSRRAELVDSARPAHRLSLRSIAEASTRIDPVFRGSPQYVCGPLAELAKCRLTLKIETLNPIRSFKGRGADWLLAEEGARGAVVCASAGNFGQAMAYACARRGVPLVVFASRAASALKVARMRALGAEVTLAGEDFEAAKEAARAFAIERGARFVEDGRDARISEGAGTIAVELLAGGAAFDTVVVPVGDGALINGVSRWIKARAPWTRVVGVCARGASAMHDSWKAGARVAHPRADTIADGIAVRAPVDAALADMRGLVDDVVLVDDAAIVDAMRALFAHAGIATEPAGAAGVAAVLAGAFGQNVATIVTGSNAAPDELKRWGATDGGPS